MSIKVLDNYDKIDLKKWDQFIMDHDNGNFFQTPALYQFYSKVAGYKPYIVVVESGGLYTGCLLAVVIREESLTGYFSARAIITGGPLVINNDNDVFRSLILRMASLLRKRAIFIEIRNMFNFNKKNSLLLQSLGYKFLPYQNFLVPLKKLGKGEVKISKSKKRQIKTSLRNGASVSEPENLDEIRSFYEILSDLYKRKIKKPLPDLIFFETFYRSPELGKFFIIKLNNTVVGGILCPIFNNKIIYEWYIAGLNDVPQGVFPGVLATWAPIDYGLENGFEYFDFMGAGRIDKDYGVREFKSKFAVETVKFGRHRRINSRFKWIIANTGLLLLSAIRKS